MSIKDVLQSATLESQGHTGHRQNFDEQSDDLDFAIDNPLLKSKNKTRIEISIKTIICVFTVFLSIVVFCSWASWNLSLAMSSSFDGSSKLNNNGEIVSRNGVVSTDSETENTENSENNTACEKYIIQISQLQEQITQNSFGQLSSQNLNDVAVDQNGVVNLNLADINDLQTLKGVGPSTAQRILDYREQNGKFKSIEELKEVKGIGPATFDKLKPKIKV